MKLPRFGLFAVAFVVLNARAVTAQQSSAATHAITTTAPGAAAAVNRSAFENGLKVSPASNSYTLALEWAAFQGADSYRVLRYKSTDLAPATLYSADTHYVARVLPGMPFVFRVVAYAHNQPVDTTIAVSVSVPGGADTSRPSVTCTISSDKKSALVSWLPIPFAKYTYVFETSPAGVPPVQSTSQVVTETHVSQTIPQDMEVREFLVTPTFQLQDYPSPGQTATLTGGTFTGEMAWKGGMPGCGPKGNRAPHELH